MVKLSPTIQQLVDVLAQLPGIGRKTAMRLAFYILRDQSGYALKLADILSRTAASVVHCERCGNFADESPCQFCQQTNRDRGTICVVASAQDMLAIEQTGEYRGDYHVLHGLISPLQGIGPDDLQIASLVRRVAAGEVRELILATSPSVEGEATALYVKRLFAHSGLVVTRIASGVPMGSELEFADKATLGRSLLQRRDY